jgi:hypothetical protein
MTRWQLVVMAAVAVPVGIGLIKFAVDVFENAG